MEPETFGQYTLLRRVATGGTAEIFLARRHGVDGFARHLAIKRILPHLAEQPEFVQLLLDEARLAAHLHHGHIIQIHEVGVESDHAYIAMEYLPGTDLGRLMKAAAKRRRRVLVAHPEPSMRESIANALSELKVDVCAAADAVSIDARSAEGAVDLAIVDGSMVGPIRDPLLHTLQTRHPELLRTVLLTEGTGRGHGCYVVTSDTARPEAVLGLARGCLAQKVPLELGVQILRAVADSLEHAHTATDFDGAPLRMVHRDVNPSNVLVSVSGMVKLVDFGIARATTSVRDDDAGNFVGTYRYMSPEQSAGSKVDARSDVFSFATVLYELVAGHNPYEGENHFATMRAIRDDAPPTLRDAVPGLPKALGDIFRQAAAKAPAARYQRTEQLLGDIEDFARLEGLNLSPKRLSGFMSLVYGRSGLKRFGVSGTGTEIRALHVPATPAPRVPRRPTPDPEPETIPVQPSPPVSSALPNEIDVDLDDIEIPVDREPAPPSEAAVGRTHPLDFADLDGQLGPDAPELTAWRSDSGLRVMLTLLIVALLAVAGWYWHWRTADAGEEAALSAPLTAHWG